MNLSSMMYRLNVQQQQQTMQQQPSSQQQQQHQQQQTTSVIPSHILLQQQINAANAANSAAITLQQSANPHLLTSDAPGDAGVGVPASSTTTASPSTAHGSQHHPHATSHHSQHQQQQQQHHLHHQQHHQTHHGRHNPASSTIVAVPSAASVVAIVGSAAAACPGTVTAPPPSSAPVEEKIKLLTTAIKSEPMHDVITLTATNISHTNHSNNNNTGNVNKHNKTNNSNNTSNNNGAVSLKVVNVSGVSGGGTGCISNINKSTATPSVALASAAAAAAATATVTPTATSSAAAIHLNSNINSINLVVGVGNNLASTSPIAVSVGQVATAGGIAGGSSSTSIVSCSNNNTNGHLVFVPSKRARLEGPEDWISSPSPGSVPSSAPPLSPSPGLQNHSYNANMSNGYASPLSAGSYDPYSPNGKIGRDDLSPSSSLNGYSEGCDAKKSKKGPAPRLQEELCLVCGDRASGYHYNALTCEGCKGFFRRSVTKNAVYCCKFGHACEMDMYMRRKCQECRLKKCLAVGMRPECVVPENQCAMKRREKKAQKEKDKQQASPSSGNTSDFIKKEILELMTCEPPTHPTCPLLPEELLVANQARNIPSLTINQLAVIYKLIWYQDGYEQPSEEDLKRIMISSPDENESQHDISFRHITEITILTVQLIVEFAKGLPAFTKIPQEDQITLLKACSSEVMMLRMARRYDHASDSIFFANNRSYTRESYKMAGMADNIEDLLHFCRQMFSMKVDNVEYALLTAIVIFSDRPGLEEAELVEAIQSYYIDTLRIYILNRHCGDPKSLVFFAKLLSILTELRTLGNQNAEMCFSLKLKNRKLPKFLEEIWDVHAIPPSVQSHIQAMQAERAAQEPSSCDSASTSSAAAAAACSSSTSSTAAAASSTSSTSPNASSSASGLNGDDEVRIVGVNTLYGAALTTSTPMSSSATPGLNLMNMSLGQDHHMLGGTHSTVA